MSATSHFGTMEAGRKQQVAEGGGERRRGVLLRALKKLCVVLTMDTHVLAPSAGAQSHLWVQVPVILLFSLLLL